MTPPAMANFERSVLEFYQLPGPYPLEWPAEKDQDDGSDDEDALTPLSPGTGAVDKRKSRFQALERATSERKSLVPGAQKTGDGLENLVQRDEADPLGSSGSVVSMLRQLGLPVQEDVKLRNRFLLSSTTFSPAMFLSQVHSGATTHDLLQGLDNLSKSIDQKSASLKVLVESNFERFVRAKATIDNVYMEMKNRGQDNTATKSMAHGRHPSKGSYRSSIGFQDGSVGAQGKGHTRKRNALIKDSEYGVLGIKTPLLELSAKAEELWGPVLSGKGKEDTIVAVAESLEQHKEQYEINAAIAESIRRRDHESLVEEYAKARRFADAAKQTVDQIRSNTPPTDAQIYQILLAARIWHNVQHQLEDYKRDVWRRLTALHGLGATTSKGAADEQYMELIGILLELGVEENPIWVWLHSRYEYLRTKIQTTSDRCKVEIEIARRKLANSEKPTTQMMALHLKSLTRKAADVNTYAMDTAEILRLWEKSVGFLTQLLGDRGLLGEILDYWNAVQGFLDGTAQKSLPSGINGTSRDHHTLSDQRIMELQKGTIELVDMLRENILGFFAEPPLEDISALFSPLPPTPDTPTVAGLTPTNLRSRTSIDPNSVPPPSPKRGEAWEKFAFWPPWSNSISGVHYLAKLLTLVGNGAGGMATVKPISRGDGSAEERLKNLIHTARERSVTAICAAWNKDAENIKVLEDWRRSNEQRDLTMMPANFGAFEGAILTGMQRMLYIPDAHDKSGRGVIQPPTTKLLQMVRSQFVTTLYKALSGMVENAERAVWRPEDDLSPESEALASPVSSTVATRIGAGTVNASDRSLRADVVPALTAQFESSFSVKLTEEAKTIRDVLGQIDARLFQTYTRPSVDQLRIIVRNGITAPSWEPDPSTKPSEVRPYVYDALLTFVLVHTQVSTTASTLTMHVLSYLLEQLSRDLFETFKQRQKYTLASLMQATLDVEFVAQTLSQYTTDRASELQSQIYQELDRGTDNDARQRLQSELPEMRAVLKRLRESSKSEFACFRKPRTRKDGGDAAKTTAK